MTRKNSTKRALVASLLAMVMTVTMLMGTTFAWFTDSVTSSGNVIKTGDLKIGMEWKDATATGAQQTYKSATDGAIFNYVLWEPGYVEAKNIKISNNGSLALKYQLSIEPTGTVSDLSDVIDVFYAEGEYTLSDRGMPELTRLGTLTEVLNALPDTAVGDLKQGESDTVTLALMMQEGAGNQYQDKSIGTSFAIKCLATQLSYEEDSFDDQYDANLDASANGISKTLDDGSTVFYYNEESGNAGIVRLTKLPENIGNEYKIPAGVNYLGSALAGVTLDKLTIPAGVDYSRKSLQGANIGEVVIEDGATTIPDRMFYQTNVESVVIPDSVTKIEQYAFMQAGVKNLVVPASVTTFEEGCFAYMPNLETVLFEGDAILPTYAFRSCPKLAKVEIKGDVTVATTSMVFSNYESGGKDDMVFYVSSLENAEELTSCLGAYNDVNTGKDRNKWTVYVNETVYANVKNAAELKNLLNNATQDTVINFTANISAADGESIEVPAGVNAVLDLGGYSLTASPTAIAINSLGNTTVKNGTVNVTAPANSSNGAGALAAQLGGVLTLEGVKLVTDGGLTHGITLNNGTLNLNEGSEIVINGSGFQTGIISFGNDVINVNGGKITVNAPADSVTSVGIGTYGTLTVNANSGAISVNDGSAHYGVAPFGGSITVNLKDGFTTSSEGSGIVFESDVTVVTE